MKNRFDLIIFDWDGTLVNSIDWISHCLINAAKQCNLPCPELQAAKDVIGLSIKNAMHTLFPDAQEQTLERLINYYSQEYHSKEINKADLFPGVYDMLVQLKQAGFQLAVATGKNRNGLQKALHATETEALFCATRCADETASKPHPRMLKEIMAHTQIASQRTLMVGDSIHDLQMAANAHTSFVAVSCGAHSEDYLRQHNPLLCLQQPAQLLDHLR
jgi:phosphoglycolate phosphatase